MEQDNENSEAATWKAFGMPPLGTVERRMDTRRPRAMEQIMKQHVWEMLANV